MSCAVLCVDPRRLMLRAKVNTSCWFLNVNETNNRKLSNKCFPGAVDCSGTWMNWWKWQAAAMPQIGCEMEHPHARLIHPGFTCWSECSSVSRGQVAAGPVIHMQWRTLLRRATNQRPGRWCMQHDGYVFQTIACNWNTFCYGSHNMSYHHRLIISNWTTSLQVARRFFRQKHHSHQQRQDCTNRSWAKHLSNITIIFRSCPKLVIFICKQLKRPVAFGAVHWGWNLGVKQQRQWFKELKGRFLFDQTIHSWKLPHQLASTL